MLRALPAAGLFVPAATCLFLPQPHPLPACSLPACPRLRFIMHSKKTAFIVEHDFIMAAYLADR